MSGKKWYKSKLLWFNALSGAFAVVEANFQILQGFVKPHYYLMLLGTVNAVNVFLRIITTSPIYFREVDKKYGKKLHDAQTNSRNT